MPESASNITAQMPRAKLAGLLLFFLGPAVVIYTLFSIYPLVATMALSPYTSDPSGARSFVGYGYGDPRLGHALCSRPSWNPRASNLICFAVPVCVQNP